MYRILVVDDERLIVNSLVQLLSDSKELELDVCPACNVVEAMEWADRARIDIVLSDMRMPGMNGVELQRKMLRRWPRCRFVFLTAFDDLSYAQQAIHNGRVTAYLMKNAAKEEIVQAVLKAIEETDNEIGAADWLHRTERFVRTAMPLLQKEYLLRLLDGEESVSGQRRAAKFAELDIGLDADRPVYLLVCRMDEYGESVGPADRTLVQYAVQNIVEEYLQPYVDLATVVYDRTKLVCFLQPRSDAPANFIYGSLESAQGSCRSLLKLPLSVVLGGEASDWTSVGAEFARMKRLLRFELAGEKETMRVLGDLGDGEPTGAAGRGGLRENGEPSWDQILKVRIEELGILLDCGQEEAFFRLLSGIAGADEPLKYADALELYHSLALFFTSCLNRMGMTEELGPLTEFRGLAGVGEADSWPHSLQMFKSLAQRIFELRASRQTERTRQLILQAQQFIRTHLAEDLSLTRLSGLFNHSASYFSRIFKRETGVDLSDYIIRHRMQAAKELLLRTQLKIYEVSVQVGYESVTHFTKMFKKTVRQTPQEFRETNASIRYDK